MPAVLIIKRSGKRPTEDFSAKKLHASVTAACLSVRCPLGEAESIAKSVLATTEAWLSKRPEVMSDDLRRKISDALTALHPEAGYLYKHHRLVI